MNDARDVIAVRGARTHNLRGVDVDIPRGQLVAICGPSGSGKSSLAFDTLHAEAQRRLLDAMSTQTRGLLDRLPLADVDAITGLPPSIAMAQHHAAPSSRTTVGTSTEIDAHLRLLFARTGVARCPICGDEIRAWTPQAIVDEILALPTGAKVTVHAPIARDVEGDLASQLAALRAKGFARAFVDDLMISLDDVARVDAKISRRSTHHLDVVIDRLVVATREGDLDALRVRATDSIELGLRTGHGVVSLRIDIGGAVETRTRADRGLCLRHGFEVPNLEPRLFSPNDPRGACPACRGLGERLEPDLARVVADPEASLRRGAIAAWGAAGTTSHALSLAAMVKSLKLGKPLVDRPWSALDEEVRAKILEGYGAWIGVLPSLRARLDRDEQGGDDDLEEGALDAEAIAAMCRRATCNVCNGSRLSVAARAVWVADRTIDVVRALPLEPLEAFLRALLHDAAPRARAIVEPIVTAMIPRVRALRDLGLDGLCLDRAIDTLSTGESQRVRIAGAIAGALTGLLYVIDEPTAGLHPSDVARLLEALSTLKARGSVVVVDHDLALLRGCDWLIDVGPGAGALGGKIVAEGTPHAIAAARESVTGPYLSGRAHLPRVQRRAFDRARAMTLAGARTRDVTTVDLTLPLDALVAITGPSGAGKTVLLERSLGPCARALRDRRPATALSVEGVAAFDATLAIDRVVVVDTSSLGRSRRSCAATASGLMDAFRACFAGLPEARQRGYGPGRFSFNAKGGRCETCRGEGSTRVAMAMLADVEVPCPTCDGARFNRETLEVRYRGLSIADILRAPVDALLPIFDALPAIAERLRALQRVGLGYLQLGQPASTLSGGEAQRVRLASELLSRGLAARDTTSIFLLDEPTCGLHPRDVSVLLDALVALRDEGASIVVADHDMDFVARCDWVVDLDRDGAIAAEGTPDVVAAAATMTSPFLRAAIARLDL